MIKVIIKNKPLVQIEIKGHANFGEYGKDIVCSAVSVLTYSTINQLKLFNEEDNFIYNLEEGYFKIKDLKLTLNGKLIIKNLIEMLKGINESYSEFLEVLEI